MTSILNTNLSKITDYIIISGYLSEPLPSQSIEKYCGAAGGRGLHIGTASGALTFNIAPNFSEVQKLEIAEKQEVLFELLHLHMKQNTRIKTLILNFYLHIWVDSGNRLLRSVH